MKKNIAVAATVILATVFVASVAILFYLLRFTTFLDEPLGHLPALKNIKEIHVSLDNSGEKDFIITDPDEISELVSIMNVETNYIFSPQSPTGRILIVFISKNNQTFSFLTGMDVDRQMYYLNEKRDVEGINADEVITFLKKYPQLEELLDNSLWSSYH